MVAPKNIRVVKVPLSKSEIPVDRPIAFPRMPVLYLELFENKKKIKQDLINQEYHPHQAEGVQLEGIKQSVPHSVSLSSDTDSDDTPVIKDNHKSSSKSSPEHIKNVEGDNISISSSSDSEDDVGSIKDESDNESNNSDSTDDEDGEDGLANRLHQLLADDDSVEQYSDKSEKIDKYSRPHRQSIASEHSIHSYVKQPNTSPLKPTGIPPTLEELKAQGHYHIPEEYRDVNFTTTNEADNLDKKREILFKFDLLKKSYPLSRDKIPEYTIHSELGEMQKEYDMCVRKLSLDSTVDRYKQYLYGGFVFTEFVMSYFLKFDMQGFTTQQMVQIHQYERLLIELGEKSYVPQGSKWPVELRLLFMIVMNAGVFIVGKLIMRKTGADFVGMMNHVNSPPPTNNPTNNRPTGRKMRGPSINLDDIPDVNNVQNNQPNQTSVQEEN